MTSTDVGYIKLARRLENSEIWRKPSTWVRIWLHLLLHVDWTTHQGEFCYSQSSPYLPDVDRSTWLRCLAWLEETGSITRARRQHGELITVANWDRYQDGTNYTTQPTNSEYTPGFQDFWARYPSKIKMLSAWRAWRVLVVSGRVAEVDVLAGLDRLLAAIASKRVKTWPPPTTWLRSGAWADVYSKPTAAPAPENHDMRLHHAVKTLESGVASAIARLSETHNDVLAEAQEIVTYRKEHQ